MLEKIKKRCDKKFLLIGLAVLCGLILLQLSSKTKAASLTSAKDTISDSDKSVVANHTIVFTTATEIPVSGKIVIDFHDSFDIGAVDFTDMDVATSSGEFTLAASPGSGAGSALGISTTTTDVITVTLNDTDVIPSGRTITIEIGTHATTGATGDQQVTNPSSADSYAINVETQNAASTALDSVDVVVAIIDDVVVTATVSSSLTFTITGLGSSVAVNTDNTTVDVSGSATAIAFGTLTSGSAKIAGQRLAVTTNATNGFVVTVQQTQNLTNDATDDIDSFKDGTPQTTPSAWTAPVGTLGSEATYGHFGFTSEDSDLNGNEFGDALYAGFDGTTADQVMSHSGPSDGSTADSGSTDIGYKIETDALQEAGTYTNTLTYVCTPTY